MECNKDEAIRAKEIAVNKMQNGDFQGALKLAKKAIDLFPELDNISQILAVCDIHIAAGDKIGDSELDLYKILQLEKSADEATIRKQYKQLAYAVHPDRNRFPGAEAAFKLVHEANVVLSDQDARSLYDSRRRELEGKIGVVKPKGDVKDNAFGSNQGNESPFHINTQNQRRDSFANSYHVPWGTQNIYHGYRSSKAKEEQEEMDYYLLNIEICDEALTRNMSSGLQTENRQHISAGRTQPSSKPNHQYQQLQSRYPYAGVQKTNYANASAYESQSSINTNIAQPPRHSDVGAKNKNANIWCSNANPHRQAEPPHRQHSSAGGQKTNANVSDSNANHHRWVQEPQQQQSSAGAQKINANVSGSNSNPHRQAQEPQPQQSLTEAQKTNANVSTSARNLRCDDQLPAQEPRSSLREQNYHRSVEPDVAQESSMCFPFAQTVHRLFQRKKKDQV